MRYFHPSTPKIIRLWRMESSSRIGLSNQHFGMEFGGTMLIGVIAGFVVFFVTFIVGALLTWMLGGDPNAEDAVYFWIALWSAIAMPALGLAWYIFGSLISRVIWPAPKFASESHARAWLAFQELEKSERPPIQSLYNKIMAEKGGTDRDRKLMHEYCNRVHELHKLTAPYNDAQKDAELAIEALKEHLKTMREFHAD